LFISLFIFQTVNNIYRNATDFVASCIYCYELKLDSFKIIM